jgi:hypothetical protein
MAAGTAMKIDRALLGLVPVGEENAVSARLLWQMNRIGAVATVKCKLTMMASEGLVQRKKVWRPAHISASGPACSSNVSTRSGAALRDCPLGRGVRLGHCNCLLVRSSCSACSIA